MSPLAAPPMAGSLPAVRADLATILNELTAGLAEVADTHDAGSVLVAASVLIDPIEPLACWAAARASGEDANYWHQPDGSRSMVGVGAAWSIELVGADRFQRAARAWSSLTTDVRQGGSGSGFAFAGPLLVGGATFADRRSDDACWTGFEHGRLVVPSLAFVVQDATTVLTACLVIGDPSCAAMGIAATLDRLDRLDRAGATWWMTPRDATEGTWPSVSVVDERPDRAAWSSSVARSAGAVGRGRIDKVVLARRVDLASAAAIDPVDVLRRLAEPVPGVSAPVTRFAWARGSRTFLGASPERLVATDGRTFRTIALAGTTGRGGEPASDAALAEGLLASEKDREEHVVVVDMLRETLAPLAASLDIDRAPHIVRLPTLQHLGTDVSGELRDDIGILDLVHRLHPTPAVGGWPRAAALELLNEQEHLDRGWYAGPVGWLDARGHGEFVVAIRSGVVDGDRASLFVGCGIVGDSEPDREWAESAMKLRSLASAIGRLDP